ncbi:MAG: FTR1 family protein [Spirochaetales bacterium]
MEGAVVYSAWDVGFLLFREGLEALLVIAALVSFLNKAEQKSGKAWVWTGAGLGLAVAIGIAGVVSTFVATLSSEFTVHVVEAVSGLVAVVLMLSVGVWLHGKAQIRDWNKYVKDQMSSIAAKGSFFGLGLLAFLSVLREGGETVVFFWGLAAGLSPADFWLGVGGALAVLAVIGVVLIGFSRRLPLQWFFPIATALIYFLAVKIFGQSLHAMQETGWLPATEWKGLPEQAWFGLTATFEAAVPQLLLALVLVAAVLWPLGKRKAPAQAK